MYELINGGADVRIQVKMIWDGQSEETYATAEPSFTKIWSERYYENNEIYITVTVAETEGVENFKLIPMIASGGVEITGSEI